MPKVLAELVNYRIESFLATDANDTMIVPVGFLLFSYLAFALSESSQIKPKHQLNCPESKKVMFHWLPYGDEMSYNNRTKIIQGSLPAYLSLALEICCSSLQLSYKQMKVESSKEIELSIRKDRSLELSLYFPVFANKYQKEKFQRPFIGLYDSPGPIIFVNDQNKAKGAVFTALTKSWQIPALCVLLASISGVILWFLDHKHNKRELPQEFHRGSCVGLWWAFVTMTTVGYGDIAPKSFRGRLFAVIWMIIGCIALTLFNAQLTAMITSSEIPTEFVLIGKQIVIPRGGKPFLQEELNLGAEYQEVDFVDILGKIRAKTDDILMMYNYEYVKTAQKFGEAAGDKTPLKVIKTIDHRFTIGITASGNITNTEHFLRCLEREAVDRIVVKTHEIFKDLLGSVPAATQKPKDVSTNDTSHSFETMATLVALSILVLLIIIGLLMEYCGKREIRHASKGERLNSDSEENKWFKEKEWSTRAV